jgi:diacylglycerol kinase
MASFRHAFRGVAEFIRVEPNARLHMAAAVLAIAMGIWLRIGPGEWLAVVLSVAMVIAAELLNTALEILCDHVTPERHAAIRNVKDMAAAAVVVAALAALVVGLLVFGPHLLRMVGMA